MSTSSVWAPRFEHAMEGELIRFLLLFFSLSGHRERYFVCCLLSDDSRSILCCAVPAQQVCFCYRATWQLLYTAPYPGVFDGSESLLESCCDFLCCPACGHRLRGRSHACNDAGNHEQIPNSTVVSAGEGGANERMKIGVRL